MVEHGKDFDDWRDEEPHGPLLPPEDRIWRHPSELSGPRLAAPDDHILAARRRWLNSTPTRAGAGAAGLVGAILATGVVLVGTHLTAWLTPSRPASLTRTVLQEETLAASSTTTVATVGDEALSAEIATVEGALVTVEMARGSGTARTDGVIVSRDGYVVVPAAAIAGATSISVVRSDGEELIASVTGRDPATGIAVLHVEGSRMPSVKLSADRSIPSNSLMLVAWRTNQFGIGIVPMHAAPSVTSIDSGPALLVSCPDAMYLADAPPGSLILDAEGRLSGMVVVHRNHRTIATPGWVIGRVTSSLVSYGRVVHGWLGIKGTGTRLRSGSRLLAAAHGADARPRRATNTTLSPAASAVRVLDIVPGSAAARAGLRRGDMIEAVDGQRVGSMAALQAVLYLMAPATAVNLEVVRGRQQSEVSAHLQPAA